MPPWEEFAHGQEKARKRQYDEHDLVDVIQRVVRGRLTDPLRTQRSYRPRPGPNTIHQYDPTMNIAKKTKASPNCR